MRVIQCDMCEEKIEQQELASTSVKRISNILKELHAREESENALSVDLCNDCACNLEDAIDDVVESWKKNKGVYA